MDSLYRLMKHLLNLIYLKFIIIIINIIKVCTDELVSRDFSE
jgi:hypothetical protein